MKLKGLLLIISVLMSVSGRTEETPKEVRARLVEWMSRDIQVCSIRENQNSLKGPIKLRITTGKDRKPGEIKVLSKRHVGTDLEKCVLQKGVPRGSQVPTFTHSFAFHPWATKSRRKWEDVKKIVEEAGVVDAIQACRDTHDERHKGGTTYFHFFIKPDGKIQPVFKSTDAINECLHKAIAPLPAFEPVGNKFAVMFEIKKGQKVPHRFEGANTEPLDCEVRGRPCSYADADPEMTKWSLELMERAVKEKKLNCENIEEVAAWLRKQKHVENVFVGSCNLSLIVKDTVPTGYHGHSH